MSTTLRRTAQAILLGCLVWLAFSTACAAPAAAQAQRQKQAPALTSITGGFGHTCVLTQAGAARGLPGREWQGAVG